MLLTFLLVTSKMLAFCVCVRVCTHSAGGVGAAVEGGVGGLPRPAGVDSGDSGFGRQSHE